MRQLSASRLAVAAECTHFLRPDVVVDERPSYASRAGSAFHSSCEAWLRAPGKPVDLRAIAKGERLTDRQLEVLTAQHERWLSWLGGQDPTVVASMRPEVPMAWTPATDTAVELESAGHRDYSKAQPGDITGTADAVGMWDASTWALWDWKAGRSYVPPGEQNPQLRGLGLMAARKHGATRVRVSVVRVSEVDCYELPYTMDLLDLDAEAQSLRRIAARVRPDAEPVPGDHCARCPAKATCAASAWKGKKEAAA